MTGIAAITPAEPLTSLAVGERRIGPVEVLAALLVVGVLLRGHEIFQTPIAWTWAALGAWP